MAAPSQGTLAFLEFIGIFLGLSGCLLLKIDHKQSKPYMDEVFHVKQVKKFCQGNFMEWDPKITTLPGLYMISVGIMKPLAWLVGSEIKPVCSTFWLRFMNVLFAVGNLYLLLLLLRKIHGSKFHQDARGLATAATLSILPVLYFFTFFYYTDTGSTFFVLLMYLLSLHGNHKMAAFIGLIAVTFRQTNIIWVVFVAGATVGKTIIQYIQPEKKDLTQEDLGSFKFLRVVIHHVYIGIKEDRLGLWQVIRDIIVRVWGYVVLGVIFALFIIINGGIVVGDRSAHEATLHFPQLFYFASFALGMGCSHFITVSQVLNFFKFLKDRPITVLVAMVISMAMVWLFTYEHPYLLADNRHYTFYIWSKIYRRHELVKFLLVPGYVFAIWSMYSGIEHKDILWKIIFSLCVIVATVPQKLLEFRYFIIPYLLLRLNMPISSYVNIALEFALYALMNIVTIYIFIEQTFVWEHTGETQRFMW